MSIEDFYATPSQCKHLLFCNISEAKSSWVYSSLNERWELSHLSYDAHKLLNHTRKIPVEVIPAFNLAEIKKMMPDCVSGTRSAKPFATVSTYQKRYDLSKIECDPRESEPWFVEHETEVKASASLLIWLIEMSLTNPEKCKALLK